LYHYSIFTQNSESTLQTLIKLCDTSEVEASPVLILQIGKIMHKQSDDAVP